MKRILFLCFITTLFLLMGCENKTTDKTTLKTTAASSVTVKSIFNDTTLTIPCECEIIPSMEYAVFFYTDNLLTEMKEMVSDATVYDETIQGQITFLKNGNYFVLKKSFKSDGKPRYLLECDFCQVSVELGVEHYCIPFPKNITPAYFVDNGVIPITYKNELVDYYTNVSGFTIESSEEKIVIKNIKNSYSDDYKDISINFGSEITITVIGE